MIRTFAVPFAACVAASAAVLLAGSTLIDPYYRDLRSWRDRAQTAPEGEAARRLFEDAAAARAIAWNSDTNTVGLRRDAAMSAELRNELFHVGEAGSVIAKELLRVRALGRYIALRVRYPQCGPPCDRDTVWTVDTNGVRSEAQRLAIAAARARSQDVPAPVPRLHYRLSRDAGGGYAPWTAWTAQGTLVFAADLAAADRIDVIGHLRTAPSGWRIRDRWCRDGRGRLTACGSGGIPAAFRLQRMADGSRVRFSVAPAAVMPDAPGPGKHHLSDRLTLACGADGRCRPGWVPMNGSRRFARARRTGPSAPENGGGLRSAPEVLALDPWARQRNGGLQPTALVRDVGAEAVMGDVNVRVGSVIAASRDLPTSSTTRVTLDPEIQRLTHQVLSELVDRPEGGAFANLGYELPRHGTRGSLVVLELRNPATRGAIRAAAGVPRPPYGLSQWDIAAAPHDARSSLPPGAPAWTGRGWHHVPGSAWKVFSALALIDAISSGTLPPDAAVDLRRAMVGLTAADAEPVLGERALTAPGGICIPRRLSDGVKGTDSESCGSGYYGRPIRDSGGGGPLSGTAGFRFGVAEALALSSNIWFVAAALRAEAASRELSSDSSLAPTAKRLGLLAPAPLDGGIGLDLDARDAASIEALADPKDVRALASAAFGQRVQAGPLILAQLAASVATGRNVQPSLFEPKPPDAPLFRTALAVPLLDEVRRGMRGVVSGKPVGPGGLYGTGRVPFRDRARQQRSRAAGKTGTAQVGQGLDRISSFSGWLDDRRGRPAFAMGCAVTVRGKRLRDGRIRVLPLCAHAVAELMRRIDDKVLSP